MVKLVSISLLHCRVNIFFFIIDNLWGNTLRLCSILFLIRLLPTIFSIHWWFLIEIIISMVIAKCNFLFPLFYICCHSTVSKRCPFSCILLIYFNMDSRTSFILWTIILCLAIHIVPDLACGCPFKLVSILLTVLIFLWACLIFWYNRIFRTHLVLWLL